ncbi:hypothetical protein QR680_019193 [Steinernema hermaphroditum]|uniref:Malonyl-CoA decarboxylase C-terminal domain-containing protein n=1 Tax=Steinernema hermaphroditum TaxID=289476 RepID=A0AA39HMK0_9BILA|nr:hypothetical protein QR680_019193 [Steinernema hermaphroditum]
MLDEPIEVHDEQPWSADDDAAAEARDLFRPVIMPTAAGIASWVNNSIIAEFYTRQLPQHRFIQPHVWDENGRLKGNPLFASTEERGRQLLQILLALPPHLGFGMVNVVQSFVPPTLVRLFELMLLIVSTERIDIPMRLSALRRSGSRIVGICERIAAAKSPDQLVQHTNAFVDFYHAADAPSKSAALSHLATDFGIDHSRLKSAIQLYERNEAAAVDVHRFSAPHYRTLFQSLGNTRNGINFACDLRSDLLEMMKKESSVPLRSMERSLREVLTLWFCLSNLRLHRLTWKSPADVLQKIASREAVHPVQGLVDIKRRVGEHRRCFYFSHEALPREPLVVVHVALTNDISSSIQAIVKQDHLEGTEREHNTAIFYSISSMQPGLKGIDLGNLLIKRVVGELMVDVPFVKQYSTLSPIPGFRSWLLRSLRMGELNLSGSLKPEDLIKVVESNDWDEYEKTKPLLMHLAAKYLHSSKNSAGGAFDPVANFHLRNGAQLHRLNWKGDTSVRGLKNSMGIMVNYRYYIDRVPKNSAQYINEHVIDTDQQVLELLN